MAEQPGARPGKRARVDHFLKPTKRSTPCVGICSTSHGDIVCRGCKRFYNEVRDWQDFSLEQREMVENRLLLLKRECVLSSIEVFDIEILQERTTNLVAQESEDLALRLYEALMHCRGEFEGWGIRVSYSNESTITPEQVLKHIEDEFFERSQALFGKFFGRSPLQ